MAVYTEALGEGLEVSFSMVCHLLGVARSTAYYQARKSEKAPLIDDELCRKIKWIIEQFPTFGIRRVWAWLRHRMEIRVNKKKVARLMRLKGWTIKQRKKGLRPRVEVSRSVAEAPDQRWSTDIALVFCGARDGWCSFVPVVDCCTREVLGWSCLPRPGRKPRRGRLRWP